MLYADATKGVGRYFVGSPRYTRELSVANPIYRSRSNRRAFKRYGAARRRWLIRFSRRVRRGASITDTSKRSLLVKKYAAALSFAHGYVGMYVEHVLRTWDVFKVIKWTKGLAVATARARSARKKFSAPLEHICAIESCLFYCPFPIGLLVQIIPDFFQLLIFRYPVYGACAFTSRFMHMQWHMHTCIYVWRIYSPHLSRRQRRR